MIPIREDYDAYSPPRWVRPTVERLLACLSAGHVGGLSAVVLTDAATADARKTRRMRKNRRGVPLGRYHAAWSGEKAWVEIVVDRIVPTCPRHLVMFQWARDLTLAQVLFHEVGHHLDATVGAPARSGEPAAEAWRRRLTAVHFRRRYWYFRPAVPLLRLFALFARHMARRERGRAAAGRDHPHAG
jgi:hypothetical protein